MEAIKRERELVVTIDGYARAAAASILAPPVHPRP
jgi:hypothetical protein